MRTSVERLMDHFKVPATTLLTDKSAKRYRKRLDLSARIDKFAKKIESNKYSELLHALRVVGNVGRHGRKSVGHREMLDAYKAYEFALERLFEDKQETRSPVVMVTCAVAALILSFLIGLQRAHSILASPSASEMIAVDDKLLPARLIRGDDKGILFFSLDSRKVRFLRWESIKQIETQ